MELFEIANGNKDHTHYKHLGKSYFGSFSKRPCCLGLVVLLHMILSDQQHVFCKSEASTGSNNTIYCRIILTDSEYDFSKNFYTLDREKVDHNIAHISKDERTTEVYYCRSIVINNVLSPDGEMFLFPSDLSSGFEGLPTVQIVRIDGVDLDLTRESSIISYHNAMSIHLVPETEVHDILSYATSVRTDVDNAPPTRSANYDASNSRSANYDASNSIDSKPSDFQTTTKDVSRDYRNVIRSNNGNQPTSQQQETTLSNFGTSTSPLLGASQTMGILRVLIARVIGPDSEPTVSRNDLIRYTFVESVSLKDQMYKCSAGQLILLPATVGGDISGVLDIQVNDTVISGVHREVLVNKAVVSMNRKLEGLGVVRRNSSHATSTLLEEVADLIMIIIPPGSLPISWAAYGVVNGRLTVYNDVWGAYVSTTMHEVGHNLGLYHAQQSADHDEYGGQTGYMGAAMKSYSFPQKCYNSQNHWHLGWFKDKQFDITPETLQNGPIVLFVAAFVDYDQIQVAPQSDLGQKIFVLARVDDYYLQYNRAKFHNIGTTELADKLVIVKHNITSGMTDELVGLDLYNKSYTASIVENNTARSSRNLIFDICRIVNGTRISTQPLKGIQPDYVIVSIGYDTSACQAFLNNPNVFKVSNTPSAAPNSNPQPTENPAILSNPPSDVNDNHVSTRFFQNRSMVVLFLMFQVGFLISLFGIYLLFVRQYKRQKALWEYNEKKELNKRLIAMRSNRNNDVHSLYNEVGDDSSSTVSFSSDSSENQNRIGIFRPHNFNV